jgi:excisionase family DNA binding protein
MRALYRLDRRAQPSLTMRAKEQAMRPAPGPDPELDMEPLLSTRAVANWLGMSREQVWRLWSTGRLPGYRLDRHLRFARRDVEAFLAAHRIAGANDTASKTEVAPVVDKWLRRGTSSEYRRI